MKRTIATICMCALMTGCVIGVRSNMSFVNHKNHAAAEGSLNDSSQYGGSPAVNADKSYSDLLNGSGNGNGAGQSREATEKPAAEPAAEQKQQ